MLRLFLVLLAAFPILVAAYGVIQWQTTTHQRDLRSHFKPRLRLYFSDSMRWLPYLAMTVGGSVSLIAYATNTLGGISVLVMVDVGIGSYAWYVYKGPRFQALLDFHLHSAGEIGRIARSLAGYNDANYAKYRLEAGWLKGIKAPANRMAADDSVDYVLRLIWTLVAERYAAGPRSEREPRAQRQRAVENAVIAVFEAELAVERIVVIAEQYPGFGIKLGLLDWDIPGLNPPTPAT